MGAAERGGQRGRDRQGGRRHRGLLGHWEQEARHGGSGGTRAGFLVEQEAGGWDSGTQLPCALSIICRKSQLAKEGRRLPCSCELFLDALFIFDKSFRGSYFISL